MNASPVLSLALAATAACPLLLIAAEIFDSPGPGYRQQVERLSPTINRTPALRVHTSPEWVSRATRSLAEPSFSQPIRLFERAPQLPAVLPLDALPRVPKTK